MSFGRGTDVLLCLCSGANIIHLVHKISVVLLLLLLYMIILICPSHMLREVEIKLFFSMNNHIAKLTGLSSVMAAVLSDINE